MADGASRNRSRSKRDVVAVSNPVRLLDLAKQEAHSVARWYERRQTGLGRRFLQATHATLLAIEQHPTFFPHLETVPDDVPIRRAIMKEFPYLVIFEMRLDEILVLAVAHTKRRPNYWMSRRKKSSPL